METEEGTEIMETTEESSKGTVEELTTASFTEICRACLEKHKLFPIEDVHWGEIWLREVLYGLFRPKERIESNLPQSMCRICIEEMYTVQKFLQKYHGSTKILLETLKKEEKNNPELLRVTRIEYQKKYDPLQEAAEQSEHIAETQEIIKTEVTTDDENNDDDIENSQTNVADNTTDHADDTDSPSMQTTVPTDQSSSLNNYYNNIKTDGDDHAPGDNTQQLYHEAVYTVDETDVKNNKNMVENYDDSSRDHKSQCDDNDDINYDGNEDNRVIDESEVVDDPDFNDNDQDDKSEPASKKIKVEFVEDIAAEGVQNKASSTLRLQDVWYMCSTCDAPFNSYVKLEEHKTAAKHKEIQIFVCPFPNCEKRYKWHSRFVEHFGIHIAERPYQCSYCDKSFKTKDHASSHLREQHLNAASHVCTVCKKTFKRKIHLDLHFKTHTGERSVCSYCGKSFSSYSLYMHEQRHKIALGLLEPKPKETGPKPEFQCHICSQLLSSKYCLEKHVQRHGPKNYKCSQCPASYTSEEHLLGHVNIKHTDGDHICPFCGENLRQKYDLEQHQKTVHPGEKLNLYKCKICQKDFSNLISYNEHMKVHKGATNHYCEHCDKYFASESKLNRHMRTHTGDKPFGCLLCEKRFASKDYLKIHSETHNKPKIKCYYCQQRFRTRTGLCQHIEREHPTHLNQKVAEEKWEKIKLFNCEYCEQSFAEEDILNNHLHTEHSEVTVVEMVE